MRALAGARDPVTGDYLGGTRRVVANAQLYLFPGASKDRTLRWFLFTDAARCRGQRPVLHHRQVEQPGGRSLRLAFLGGYWPVVAIADGSVQLSYARPLNAKRATTSRHSSSRSEPVSSCPVTLENRAGRVALPIV